MITLYYDLRSTSSKRAIDWFTKSGLEVNYKRLSKISERDLVKILSLSSGGFDDVLKNNKGNGNNIEFLINEIERLTVTEALSLVLSHPEILKAPLIFDENKLLIGYNAEQIRVFVSKKYRSLLRTANKF